MATATETFQLHLRTAYGPVYRTVSKAPPRPCSESEIPVIDLEPIYSDDIEQRKAVAAQIRQAAECSGFFYIKNHGIAFEVIENARRNCEIFFNQPKEVKERASSSQSRFFNGYKSFGTGWASPTESRDMKESLSWRYTPDYDPKYDSLPHPIDRSTILPEVLADIRHEEFVWEKTSNLPDLKSACLTYWRACLTLARRLVGIFALALDLPEDAFDHLTTYPGADGTLNFYPGCKNAQMAAVPRDNVGLGSHTDLQCFTLLWQDDRGGLQVLKQSGEWILAPPVEGTFVVNIGDYLMRITNGRWLSTVHRVALNTTPNDRISMPFFFGFNFNETVSVLPSCVDVEHPPLFEPISCGEWCQLRFKQEAEAGKTGFPEPIVDKK